MIKAKPFCIVYPWTSISTGQIKRGVIILAHNIFQSKCWFTAYLHCQIRISIQILIWTVNQLATLHYVELFIQILILIGNYSNHDGIRIRIAITICECEQAITVTDSCRKYQKRGMKKNLRIEIIDDMPAYQLIRWISGSSLGVEQSGSCGNHLLFRSLVHHDQHHCLWTEIINVLILHILTVNLALNIAYSVTSPLN